MEYTDKQKEFLAEIKVGVKDFGIPIDNAVKGFNEFCKFINDIQEKYKVDEFVCNMGKFGIKYKYDYEIVKKFKIDLGIVYNEKVISKKDIETEYKKVFELEEIKKIIFNLDGSLKLDDLKDKKDFWKMLKQRLREENNYVLNSSSLGGINPFLKLFFDGEIKEEDLKDNKINKVFEKENVRFVVAKDNSIYFILAIPDFEFYNYLDENRGFYHSYTNPLILDYDTPKEDLELLNEINLSNLGLDGLVYIDNKRLNGLISKEKNKKRIEELKGKQEDDINKQIENVFNKKKKITLNGITRYKNGFIEYQNNKIGFKGYMVMNIGKEENDFNNMFNEIVSNFVWNREGHKTSLYCGNFKIKMERINERWHIDNIRINEGERKEVLEKALCYEKKKEYKKFLEEVSKCSIRIHNVLSSGLRYNLTSRRYNEDEIFTKIKCIRKKGKHYIVYNNKDYRISNIGYLISAQSYQSKTINTHTLAESLDRHTELNYDKAINCIAQGLKEYKEAIIKAKKLLSETIKKLNIQNIEIENSEHSGKGYLVEGGSGKKYFVSEEQKVYQYPQMRYICIINKGRVDNLNSIDLLISRLYACKNDDVLKDKIHTL